MRVFTIIGPSQSGKTTLAAAVASIDGKPGKAVTVKGVGTILPFSFMNEDWAVIDMDGGTENLSHAGPTVAASDAAVLCVSADAGAADLAALYMRLLEESDVPSIIFVNRVDSAMSRISEIAAALQTYCSHHILLRQIPLRERGEIVGTVDLISERAWKYNESAPSALIEIPLTMLDREADARNALLETLADFDDSLLEQLIEDRKPLTDDIYNVATQTVQHHDLVPLLLGSAEHKNGLVRLMKSLRHEAPDVARARARLSKGGKAIATGVMADQVKHLGKMIVVRALQGTLGGGNPVASAVLGGLTDIVSGQDSVPEGGLGIAVKSDHLSLGKSFSSEAVLSLPGWALSHTPNYRRIVTPSHERDEARLSGALERLREIDPALRIGVDPFSGHAILEAQGPQHFKRILGMLRERFGINVEEAVVPPALRETIVKPVRHIHRHRKQSGGAGQFADVQIDIRPRDRGEGFLFDDIVKGGAVPKNYIPSVQAGAIDALEQGPNGYSVVDVGVTLVDGKHHSVDSSDFAFRMAGRTAVREAVALAGTVILQPIMKVRIHVPSVYSGGLVPVVGGLKGQILGFEGHEFAAGWDVFEAMLPTASYDALGNTLASATRGTAWFDAKFLHYTEVYEKGLAFA